MKIVQQQNCLMLILHVLFLFLYCILEIIITYFSFSFAILTFSYTSPCFLSNSQALILLVGIACIGHMYILHYIQYAYIHSQNKLLVLGNQLVCSSFHVLLSVAHNWKHCKLLVPIPLHKII